MRGDEVLMRLNLSLTTLVTKCDAFCAMPRKDRFVVRVDRTHLDAIDLVCGELSIVLDVKLRECEACSVDVGVEPGELVGERGARPISDTLHRFLGSHGAC